MKKPLIEFRKVTKKFGDQYVLNKIDLKISEGLITTIIGKSGVGKSVLLKHMIGLLKQDGGDILFRGRKLSALNQTQKKAFQKKISYMFQGTALLDSLTVFENIALPFIEDRQLSKVEIKKKVTDKIEQLELVDMEQKYPSQLSGGMKKRVAMARALVTEPELVLFDEPTTGLDPIRKKSALTMIADYRRRFKFTGVIVSHAIPEIFSISQQVAMLEHGKILFEGPPTDFYKTNISVIQEFIDAGKYKTGKPEDS